MSYPIFVETLWLCIRALWAYDREILNLEKMQHSDYGKMMSNYSGYIMEQPTFTDARGCFLMVKITIFDLFTNEPPSWPRPLGTERHGTTRPGKREEKTDGKITMLLMGK